MAKGVRSVGRPVPSLETRHCGATENSMDKDSERQRMLEAMVESFCAEPSNYGIFGENLKRPSRFTLH